MLVIDSQIHIWQNSLPPNPYHRQISSYSYDDALREMDEAGVDAALIHPPAPRWDPQANELAIAAVRQHPNRFAILGHFPLDRPESRGLVNGWKQRPGMLGLRFVFLQPHQRTWPTDGTINWLWPAAERAAVPVALLADFFLPEIGHIAERHPGLRLLVDHMGRPDGVKDAEAFASLPELLALGKYANVGVKVSGVPSYSSSPYPYRNIHTYLRQIYDAFGPERMFWGTDITRMACSWRQCVTLFTEELSWLTEHDKELIMGRALCQ
jgi:predicted TIM-barrel fold metal-dependent hydrolase